MQREIKKWIWQHKEYPNFPYDKEATNELISTIEYNRGLLNGICSIFNSKDLKDIEINALTQEGINTSEIEGEFFTRESVRSSAKKKLNSNFNLEKDSSTQKSDALVSILVDCNINKEPLTIDRLHKWHSLLFVNSRNYLEPISIAKFREIDDMQVVSGAIGQERVHYLAPPKKLIKNDILALLKWCNNSKENIYIKSAIAHLWFVAIHPYDDGNGRIARAITDYLLSSTSSSNFKLYSVSAAINKDRREYYNILDRTTNIIRNRNYDFTPWILWHLKTLNSALEVAIEDINSVIKKTKFWDRCKDKQLNERQLKVINKIFDNGGENFIGGLSNKKYTTIAKTSRATAARDISQLLEYGCIRQIKNTAGRNVRYELVL